MKKLFFVLPMLSLVLVVADAAEQDTVNRCTAIIGEFRQMPEKAIPRDVLSHARGLAIISVVKGGLIFIGKGGKGVVVAVRLMAGLAHHLSPLVVPAGGFRLALK